MTNQQIFSLRKELTGDLYRAVLQLGMERCPTVLLVVRDPRMLDASCREALGRLEPHLIEAQQASEWPGTALTGDTATVYRYQTSSGLEDALKPLADRLYDWKHPGLPEDLCFLRSDETPWLVSIAHEQDAYFEITLDELEELLDLEPRLADIIVKG